MDWTGDSGTVRTGRAVRYTVRVENISVGEALKLSNGKSAPFVSAPVLWVIHTGSANPISSAGSPTRARGSSSSARPATPARLAAPWPGGRASWPPVPPPLPVGATADGPLTPGQKYEFEVSAEPGQSLSAAWMFGQSNDLFYSNDRPIALFNAEGHPIAESSPPSSRSGMRAPR